MEDDNGLDLSLSLPYGGPSTSFKGKNDINSEARVEETNRGSKLIDDFKNFLDGGTQNEDCVLGFQRSNNQAKPEENLFYDLSKSIDKADDTSNGGFWDKNDGRRSHEVQEVRQDTSSKRKNLFDEINHQKRHEREAHLVDLHDKTTDEGSKQYLSGTVTSGYASSGMVQVVAPASNDRQGTQQPVVPATLQLMFGYSPVQKPTVEPGKFEGLASRSLQIHPSYFGRGPPNSNKQNDELEITQATKPVNASKPFEEGPSSHNMTSGTGDQSKTDRCPPEHPTITPGITAELKFGGSGSSSNLPWVSTTGPGPNGKTISGVTYEHSGTQVRIVCACHGSHMSVEEFVQHANEEQPDIGSDLASFSNSNPAASAQS